MPSRKPIPKRLSAFAQNGYFEIYGEDAKKAAPALGTKLLMKELEGGGQVAVTGFREDQWVAKAKALWGQGNDVLVTQSGEDGRQETVKHLLAEDYIPVGMVMDMDGKTVRVDKVDFPNEEVSLTDITDRKIPFHSMSGCLLSVPMWRKLRLKASGKQWIAESIPLRRRLLSSQSSKNTPRLRRIKALKSLSKQRNRNQKEMEM